MAKTEDDRPRPASGKPMLLLGAGASIDAGLADTNKLTRDIYQLLTQDYDKTPAKVFGYIVSRILSRKVREGSSPFVSVNVEEAFDGVERLVNRNEDPLFEFVSSWDPFLDSLFPSFSRDKFINLIQNSMKVDTTRSFHGTPSLRFDHFRLNELAEEIEKSSNRSNFSAGKDIITKLIQALVACLKHDEDRIGYMSNLIKYIVSENGMIGSLNYDLVVEQVLKKHLLSHSYGLSSWNEKKIVSFSGTRSDVRILKMHGSLNWYSKEDNIDVDSNTSKSTPLMIFGGANKKLRPDGPFLQIRHEFERGLLATNLLIVVGYSFSDAHLNAIIRRWMLTRRRAKLVILNPTESIYDFGTLGYPYIVGKEGRFGSKTVDIVHIRRTAAAGMAELIKEAKSPINLTILDGNSKALPIIRVIN